MTTSNTTREWYLRGAESGNPNVPGGYQWWLHCNACNFQLPPGMAAAPRCPDCGAPLHIHSNAAPFTIIWPRYHVEWPHDRMFWGTPG